MCIILVSINTLDTTTKKQIKYIKNKTFIISAKLAFYLLEKPIFRTTGLHFITKRICTRLCI